MDFHRNRVSGPCHRCTRTRSQPSAFAIRPRAMDHRNRIPGGPVNGIAQTADGYLWIGTDRGLIRFDGFGFRPVSFTSIATASNVSILQLLTDAGGRLWVRPQGADLVRQQDGKFESVRYGPVAITALSKDNHDGVLV